MYNLIVKHNIKKAFELVNNHQYEKLIKNLSPAIRHHFSDEHALGSTCNDRKVVRQWFDRLGRLLPNLKLIIGRVIVNAWPKNTLIIAQWTAAATRQNGDAYRNQGVHFVTIKWGKITGMSVYVDFQAVADALEKQYTSGIEEAKAAKIIS